MVELQLYQTVENRNNPDEVERSAPFKCENKNAWLGEGYYFWDKFIVYARKWGEKAYNGNYFICEVVAEYEQEEVLDLVGNSSQIFDISEIAKKLEKEYRKKITVPFIIQYLKAHTSFDYKMIRAHSVNAFPSISPLQYSFVSWNNSYIDLRPIIQCCVLDKSILKLPVKIISSFDNINASCI